MSPQSDDKESVFVDRRKSPENLRSVIDVEFNEWNRRRDDNLKAKLDALIAYHALSLTTRADALNTAIARIQGDTSACSMRCNKQVAEFYGLINGLRHDYVREFEKFKAHEIAADKEFSKIHIRIKELEDKLNKTREELDTKIDSLEMDTESNHNNLKTRFTVLENWKSMNWKQTLIWGACAVVALIQLLSWLQKMIHIKPMP